MKHYKQFIDGEWCDASDGGTITTINPATEEEWATVPAATEDDVNRAVHSAQQAMFSGPWSTMTATQRANCIFKLADLIGKHAYDLGGIETIDSGKLAKETRMQTGYVSDYYRYFAGLADKIEGQTLPIDKPDMHVFTTREPIGVVAAVVPWNAQMFLTATKLGPALAAGNAVVLKASEEAPAPMFEFARIVEEAGFPNGVINVITGFGEPCGRALTAHPGVARVAFTGGPETASRVIANTAENYAHVSLELGGKSPIVVFEDADIEGAVNGIIAGNFGASGQSCVAGSRVILHRKIRDAVVEKLVDRASRIVIGDPLADDTQMGPLATKAQIERIEKSLSNSKTQGADILHGGEKPESFDKGYYFKPTILACPSQDIDTVNNEMFGPVMSTLVFEDEEEAIQMANNTRFGLGSGLFTENLARAHRVGAKIRSGILWVNTYRAISPIAPFGGFGHSGFGREAGTESILDYTRTKTTWINTSSEPMANPFVMR
ncbi:MAG: aldehyde dehydrogenase [Pseudomonadota bacterium]